MIKNLIVCGDSFNSKSRDAKYQGTHWSEILSKSLSLNLINLAYSGCSTRMVSFQVMESINYKDSMVIVMPSSTARRYEILKDINLCHRENISLKNFIYIDREICKDSPKFIESVNVNTLKEDKLAIKFLTSRVPWGLMKEMDNWALFYSLHKIRRANINFLLLEGLFWPDNNPYDLDEFIDVFGEDCIVKRSILSFEKYGLDKTGKHKWFEPLDPGYHTTPESQIEIAEILKNEIINRNMLNEQK
jgi:hypothetical protein